MFFAGRLVTRRVSLALLRSRASRIARFSLSAVHAENVEQQQPAQAARQKFEFQAETKSLLDIVAKSLYSEQEVFIRELISNASDALEKRRCEELLSSDDAPGTASRTPLQITITTDKEKRRLSIADTGIGMSREEVIQVLGTIAKSGSREFVRAAEGKTSAADIIGQFGMGFYSCFMVAERVTVTSRKRGQATAVWTWNGSDNFEVCQADDAAIEDCGTRIDLDLKAGDASQFCESERLTDVINKYSSFVIAPILLNGERVNTMDAIWMREARDIDAKTHEAFYHQLAKTHHPHLIEDRPQYTMQYKTDAPLNIRALIYVPSRHMRPMDFQSDLEQGLDLYARRVLIKPKAKELLPRFLRFLVGVVDSEDIPLNLSREMLQMDAILVKLRRILTDRVVNFFVTQMNKDRIKYNDFYRDYGFFFKEGICTETEQPVKEEIAKLLLFESSNLKAGTLTSISEYVDRKQSDQKTIYYLFAPNRQLAEGSPYFEMFKSQNREVLFVYDVVDEMVFMALPQFHMCTVASVETWALQQVNQGEGKGEGETVIRDVEKKQLLEWIKQTLGSVKVHDIEANSRQSEHPAMLTGHVNMARQFVRYGGLKEMEHLMIMRPTLHVSLNHPLIVALAHMRKDDPKTAELLIEQIYDNALVTSGLMKDSSKMIPRLTKLLTQLVDAPKSQILTP